MPPDLTSIWQVTSSKSWGGRESVPVALHQAFLGRGINSDLFCARDSAIAVRHGDAPSVYALPFAGTFDRATRRALIERLRRDPPDVVLCHYSHDLPLLHLVLNRARDARLFLVKHVGPGRPKKGIIHRWVYRRVDGVLAVSEYIARRCRESYPIDQMRVRVWHPGTDMQRFHHDPVRRAALRHSLGLQETDVLIGYIARLTPGKGHRDLIEAFQILAKEKPNLFLALPGSASPTEQDFVTELRRWADTGPGGKKIFWPGFVEDVPEWLWAFDIFANPSPAEAFGLNTIEAMAAGLPVVGTTGGGTPDIITNGQNGLLVAPGEVRQLCDALRRLTLDANLRHGFREAAAAAIRQRFDLGVVVENLLELVA